MAGTNETEADVYAKGLVLPADVAHIPSVTTVLGWSQIIAVPTDTVYKFACLTHSKNAMQKIYKIKGSTTPMTICVGNWKDVKLYAEVKHLPFTLLSYLFPPGQVSSQGVSYPGPVTVILPRGDSTLLRDFFNPGSSTVGVTIPFDPFLRTLCGTVGALALTSANLSSQPRSVTVNEFKDLWDQCSFVFDDGLLPSERAGSTIVDLTLPETFKIVRDGSASPETRSILREHFLTERYE